MQRDLTAGSVTKGMLLFAGPMILGNLLQQLYNVADTLIVGQFLGAGPLAAVGSSFTLMVFLTSIILGLCMGSSVVFSMLYGAKREDNLKTSFFIAFVFIAGVTLVINTLAFAFIDPLLRVLQIPAAILEYTRSYLLIIFGGIGFTFIYNYFASLLRGIGNSVVPLVFLAVSAILNIILDLVLILRFNMGVSGAALATITAQGVSAVSIGIYSFLKIPVLRLKRTHLRFNQAIVQDVVQYSLLTCVQQSIMNFGILMIQGLVNSFGVSVMAAFAAAVKIDSFAYMPVQDFGNAFSTYIAQNYGAGKADRIQKGIRCAILTALVFCILISVIVFFFGSSLMLIFVRPEETEIIAIGTVYLKVEGACYCGIGCLFLLYGLYRGIGRPGISVVLTVISLGTRVALAYLLAPVPAVGLLGIWWAIPIGWFLADITGLLYWRFRHKQLMPG
ncbi:putative efflux protein, MATE family [Eubacterium maltosivorans]|uniref:MATE family efflux transporter n=1 Tax=Eubacterium maltosivorans TaxID=2041044 RepID=UPI00088F3C62|nr:MATE family efflux transporter [Eubacterium maltosivorans]WPK82367.1 Multidrug export protein MepA [Eubacterium maltosivorans]SDO50672.1 putative efflux protein, MATE family [Eubacterium maltosivorans]